MDLENLTPEQQEAMDTYNAKYGDDKEAPEGGGAPEGEGEETETPEVEALEIPEDGEETPEEELLAGKFKSPEELAKAYKELESKLGADTGDVEDPLSEPEAPEDTKAKKAVENLDMAKYKAEVFRAGKLGEESVKEMKKAGIPESFINSFVTSEAQVKQATINEIYNITGDKETYGEVLRYASTLSSDDKLYFNSQLQSGNPTLIKGAVKSLKAMYDLNTGDVESPTAPNRVKGGSKPSSPATSFRTRDEMVEAMKDPKWQTDRDYTEKIMKKVSRSTF